jgi:hypothetical protein
MKLFGTRPPAGRAEQDYIFNTKALGISTQTFLLSTSTYSPKRMELDGLHLGVINQTLDQLLMIFSRERLLITCGTSPQFHPLRRATQLHTQPKFPTDLSACIPR